MSIPAAEAAIPSKAEENRKTYGIPLMVIPGLITTYLAYGAKGAKGPAWFHNHPLSMMTAFLTLGGISILTKKIGGRENTLLHGYILSTASIIAAFGGYVIYTNKNMYKRAHLTTFHGKFGAFILTAFLFAPIPTYILFNPDNGLLKTHKTARMLHKYGGRALLFLGLVCCATGIRTMEKDNFKAVGLISSLFAFTPVLFF